MADRSTRNMAIPDGQEIELEILFCQCGNGIAGNKVKNSFGL